MRQPLAPPAGLEPATLPTNGRDALTNCAKEVLSQNKKRPTLLLTFAPPAGLEPATL